MKFIPSNFGFWEKRILNFSPPPKKPKQTPPQAPGDPLDQILGTLEGEIDGPKAIAAVQQTRAAVNSKQSLAMDELMNQLKDAAQLAFDYLTKQEGKMPIEALDEVNKDMAQFHVEFTDTDGDGNIEAGRSTPATQGDMLMQKGKDALDVFSNPNATPMDMAKAAATLIQVAREFWERLMNGTLDETYETKNSKTSREKREAAKELRKQVKLKGAAQHKKDLNKRKSDIPKDIAKIDADIALKKAPLATAKAQLNAEQAVPADKRNTAQIGTLQAQIDTLEIEMKDLQKKKEDLESEDRKIDMQLTQLDYLQKNAKKIEQDVQKQVRDIALQFKVLGADVGNVFTGVTATMDPNTLEITLAKGAQTFNEVLKEALVKINGKLGPKNQIKVDETIAMSGVNAAGVLEDLGKLVALPTQIKSINAEFRKALAKQAGEDIKVSTDADVIKLKEFLTDKVLTEEKWIPGPDGDNDYIFDGGVVYKQDNKTGECQELDLDGANTKFVPKANQFYSKSEHGLKTIPDAGTAEQQARGHMYNPKNKEWEDKTTAQTLQNALDKNELPAGTNIKDSLTALVSGNKPKADWNDNSVAGEPDVYWDGGTNVYLQNKTSGSVQRIKIEDYINADAGNLTLDAAIANKYVNGAGQLVDMPSIATHEYDQKSKTMKLMEGGDLNLALNNMGLGAPEVALAEAAIADKTGDWVDGKMSLPPPSDDGEGVRVGDMIYLQSKANPGQVVVIDLIKNVQAPEAGKIYPGSGTGLVTVKEPNFNKRERGYTYENHEYTKKSNTEMMKVIADAGSFVPPVLNDAIKKLVGNPGWQEAGGGPPKIEVRMVGDKLYQQDQTGQNLKEFQFDNYIDTGATGAANWDPDAKYMNEAGKKDTIPDPRTHEWNPDIRDYALDKTEMDTFIDSLVLGAQTKEKAKKAIGDPDKWKNDGAGKDIICHGDKVYIQSDVDPVAVLVIDLKKVSHATENGEYFSGVEMDVVDVPKKGLRTDEGYDDSNHNWPQIEDPDVREENRKKAGEEVMDNIDDPYLAKKSGKKYKIVDKGTPADVLVTVRFNTHDLEWEYVEKGQVGMTPASDSGRSALVDVVDALSAIQDGLIEANEK